MTKTLKALAVRLGWLIALVLAAGAGWKTA